MDQVARNNFGAVLYLDKVAPTSLPTRLLAKQSNVLPKLVLLHPPDLSTSSFRGQKKPINIFKKLVHKLESVCKGGGRHGRSGMKERNEQKAGSKDVEWSMTPPSVIPFDALSMKSGPSSSPYYPQRALIEALGLAIDPVIAIEPVSYSQPRVVSHNGEGRCQGVAFSCSNVKPTRSLAWVPRRKSRYPHPMILSPPQCSQASPAPIKKVSRGASGHFFRRPSSSRRTSRSLTVGHNPKKPTYTYRRRPTFSSLSSIIQAVEIDHPLVGIHGRRSSRHIHILKRASKVLPPILPPVEIHPLIFYPFLTEFSDHAGSDGGSSAPSTPSTTTPPSDIAYVSSQKDIRDQKNLRRYGRCPSGFLNLGPSSPFALPIEQPRTDIVLAPTASTPPPRFDSLRGYSRASLEKAMEITAETKWAPSKASLRPKLTLQIPKAVGRSQRTVIHRPVASTGHCTDDIKIDTRRPRPLPTITITRQQSV